MLNKQQADHAFLEACEAYRQALINGSSHELVLASLRVHAGKAYVSSRMRRIPGHIYRQVAAQKQNAQKQKDQTQTPDQVS